MKKKPIHKYENFNSHARVGRDATNVEDVQKFYDFNSHARVGRDEAPSR